MGRKTGEEKSGKGRGALKASDWGVRPSCNRLKLKWMSLSGWGRALTDCCFQPETSSPEAPPCRTASLMMMHDSGLRRPSRWYGFLRKLLWNEKARPPELQNKSPNLLSHRFNGLEQEKRGGKSQMEAGGLRKSIAKINKWIPCSTAGSSNISISFLTSSFLLYNRKRERERERVELETPPTLLQTDAAIPRQKSCISKTLSIMSVETAALVL